MTRQELLRILIRQARANDFQFRKWFQKAIDPSWTSFDDAVELLAQGRRYYALLFAHEFGRAFWKQGSQISFVVPAASYTRRDKEGRRLEISSA
jgi:hypothetical protein